MKNILVMGGAGLGLFLGTIVGLLAAQGRLNHEGTKGIPVLHSLFPAPPEEHGEGEEGADGGHGDSGHAEDTHAAPAGETDSHGKELTVSEPGKSKMAFRTGDSIHEPAGGGGGGGGGHGADDAGAHGEDDGHDTETRRNRDALLTPPDEDWKEQKIARQGQPGSFFTFPSMEASLDVDEINEIHRKAKQMLEDSKERSTALDARESDLRRREKEVEDRYEALSSLMQEIQAGEKSLQKKIKDFEDKVLLVSKSEEADLKHYAQQLASFEAEQAAGFIKLLWETEAGRTRASKVLRLMTIEESNAILQSLDVTAIRDILENMLKVHIEQDQK